MVAMAEPVETTTSKESDSRLGGDMSACAMDVLRMNEDNMSDRSRDAMRLMHREGIFLKISVPDNIPYPKYPSPGCIGFRVHVNLERAKDLQRQNRVQLAEEVKCILEMEFMTAGYTSRNAKASSQEQLKAMLFVDIAIASDGNRLSRTVCGEFFAGGAKLVLVWCLQAIDDGKVLMGHRSVLIDTEASEGGKWAVLSLAYKMVEDISKQVNQVCHHKHRYHSADNLPKYPSESDLPRLHLFA